MILPDQQEKFWLLLQGPEHYAHNSAMQMRNMINAKSRQRVANFHRACDQHLQIIICLFGPEQVACIIKTWLNKYSLPMDPSRLPTFDQFHEHMSNWIQNHMDKIKCY